MRSVERVIVDRDKYANFHSFFPFFFPSMGSKLFLVIPLTSAHGMHIYFAHCPKWDSQWLLALAMWTALEGGGSGELDAEGGGEGQCSKTRTRHKGPKAISYSRVGSWEPTCIWPCC